MTVTKTFGEIINTPLTEEQKEELRALKDREPEPDEDCPELTPKQIEEFKRIAAERRAERNKQNITIRVSPQTIEKAKALGKGYTTVLGRILDAAMNDPETIKAYF